MPSSSMTSTACLNDPRHFGPHRIFFDEPEAAQYTQIIHDADRRLISAANFLELSIVLEGQIAAEAVRQCDMFSAGPAS